MAGETVFHKQDELLLGKPAQTIVTFQEHFAELGLEKYVSKHEMLRRVEGRLFDGREFHEYYQQNEVGLLLRREANLILCKSSGLVAKDLIDDLNARYPITFRADYLRIDFDAIKAHIGEINGIWIGQINQPNIETLALFGPGVDKSSIYEALKSLGHAASILIKQPIGGVMVAVIVSAKGSITFPQPAAEAEQMERALAVYDQLLKFGLVEEDSKLTKKEARERERDALRASKGKGK